MGEISVRWSNSIEKKKKKQQEQSILDTQELTVVNTELLVDKDKQILDLQELVVNLNEKIEKMGGTQ